MTQEKITVVFNGTTHNETVSSIEAAEKLVAQFDLNQYQNVPVAIKRGEKLLANISNTGIKWIVATDKKEKCNCWKCNGTGNIPEFAAIANGICFACKGSGTMLVGQIVSDQKMDIHCFAVDGIIWQFETATVGNEGIWPRKANSDQPVDRVYILAYPVGANLKTGSHKLSTVVDAQIGRKVFIDAKNGMSVDEMSNEYLGGMVGPYGQEAKGFKDTCAVSRSSKGIRVKI